MIQRVCQKEVARENVNSLGRNWSQLSAEGTDDRVGPCPDYVVTLQTFPAERVKTLQDFRIAEDVLADRAL